MMEGVMRSIFIAAVVITLCGFAAAADVYKIDIDDTIQPVSEDYIARAIATAESKNADALIIELKTPGGLYDSTRSIVDKILASKVPVIVYVRPGGWAASAGFFILQSGDIAAMAPGTNTGAAHPVIPGYKMDDLMKEKVENDSAAFIRLYVSKRGRNVEAGRWAHRHALRRDEDHAAHCERPYRDARHVPQAADPVIATRSESCIHP